MHDLPAGKAGAAGHRYFAGGVGHVFQHVVQVLDNGFQVGFGAGCQQQIALHCISVGGSGAVGVDDPHVTVRLPDLDFLNGFDRVVLVAQAVSIIGGAVAGTVRGDFSSAALVCVGQELQLAVCIHVGVAACRFCRPGDDLAAGQVVRVERLHAVAAVNGQAAAGQRNPCPLAGQLNQLPDSFGELCLIGPQPAGEVRIQLGHGVVGRDLVAVALGAGGLFSVENAHLGAVPGIVLPVIGQGIPGSNLQAAVRIRPDFGFNVVRKRRADGKFLPGVYRGVQGESFEGAASLSAFQLSAVWQPQNGIVHTSPPVSIQ